MYIDKRVERVPEIFRELQLDRKDKLGLPLRQSDMRLTGSFKSWSAIFPRTFSAPLFSSKQGTAAQSRATYNASKDKRGIAKPMSP